MMRPQIAAARYEPLSELGDQDGARSCVDRELVVERRGGHRAKLTAEGADGVRAECVREPTAGVVHEDVDRTERSLGLVEHPDRNRRVGKIGLNADGSASLRDDRGHHLVTANGPVAAVFIGKTRIDVDVEPQPRDEHGGALPSEQTGGSRADAVVGAGDNRDMSVEC